MLITAGDSQSSLTSFSSAACSAQASIYDSSDVPEMDPCTFAADIASGDLAVEERWLKIDSICPQAFVSIQVQGIYLPSRSVYSTTLTTSESIIVVRQGQPAVVSHMASSYCSEPAHEGLQTNMYAATLLDRSLDAKQGTREHLEFARRQLKSVPPGYVLVSNTSGSSQGDARALARNISAALVMRYYRYINS